MHSLSLIHTSSNLGWGFSMAVADGSCSFRTWEFHIGPLTSAKNAAITEYLPILCHGSLGFKWAYGNHGLGLLSGR